MHFNTKSTLKINRNYTLKHAVESRRMRLGQKVKKGPK